jgi:hypothetical protein
LGTSGARTSDSDGNRKEGTTGEPLDDLGDSTQNAPDRTSIDWSSLPKPKDPEDEPVDEEAQARAELDRELAADAFRETLEAAAMDGDSGELWNHFVNENGHDPVKLLGALKNCRYGDPSSIDPLKLMESFMETYDYRLAVHAKCAIGNILGYERMRCIRVRGKSFCQDYGHAEAFV